MVNETIVVCLDEGKKIDVRVTQRGVDSSTADLEFWQSGQKIGDGVFVNEYGEGLRDVSLSLSDCDLRHIEIGVAELFMPDKRKITIRVTTAPGTNASQVGEVYGAFEGVSWRDAVDACDNEGNGRVFLVVYGEDREVNACHIEGEMLDDDRVVSYERL